jgi:transcriptional regulator with XRE-family HTH domain
MKAKNRFGIRLTQLMALKRITQRELASALKVSHPALNGWMHGRGSAPAEAAQRLCDCFGVNLRWLLSGEGTIENRDPGTTITIPFSILAEITAQIKSATTATEYIQGLARPGTEICGFTTHVQSALASAAETIQQIRTDHYLRSKQTNGDPHPCELGGEPSA